MPFYDSSAIPNAEIEAAADALRILWNSDKNQTSLKETGFGASWLLQAQTALEAALSVRNRIVSDAPDSTQ